MSREAHAGFCERLRGQFPRPIQPVSCVCDWRPEKVWAAPRKRKVSYALGELDTLVPADAATIDKEPGVRVPGGGHPGADAALPDVAAQPPEHRSDPRPAAVGAGRATRSDRDRRAQRLGPAALGAAVGLPRRLYVVASGGLGSPERSMIRGRASVDLFLRWRLVGLREVRANAYRPIRRCSSHCPGMAVTFSAIVGHLRRNAQRSLGAAPCSLARR